MTELELLQQGLAFHRAGRAADAAERYQQVLRANPSHPDALYLLAVLAHENQKSESAIELARRAIQVSGEQARLSEILGLALMTLARYDEAEPALVRATESGSPQSFNNLGVLRTKQGRLEDAVTAFRRAVELRPGDAQLHCDLAIAFEGLKEFGHAAASYRAALQLDPGRLETIHNLGRSLFELGQADQALELFRKASQGPHPELPRAMIAVMIPGAPSASNQDILAARRELAEEDLPPLVLRRPFSTRRAGPLRIGYISSFFHRQNWMKPVWALIAHHDRAQFEIHLFSDAPDSAIAAGYSANPLDRFHDISPLANEAAARLIEQNEIDVLVDLNGYSKLRRLPVFNLRPAPVIVGWFNIFATTGMAAYDCLIGDDAVIPPAEETFYCEKIIRVPGSYLTFDVTYPVPDEVDPPCLSNGAITFGCLAPLYKITPQAIAVWSQILRDAPKSALVLRGSAFQAASARRYVIDAFAQHGITHDRIQLLGPAGHYQFLETYNSIDIALDTFPYNGGTTTTEAIWQGVPVIAFWGDRWVSRTSASILRAANLGEFVNPDLDSYIAQAVGLANSPETPSKLATLRRSMRAKLRQSPVCDVETFARNMEDIYAKLSLCSPES